MEQLGKLPKWGQWLITLLVIAGIAAAGYFLYIKGKNEEITAQQKQVDELNAQIRQGKEAQRRLEELQRQVDLIMKDLEVFKSIIPLDPQTGTLLRAFQSFARDQNLGISRITPSRITELEHYSEQPYKMVVSGGYHDLALFFDKIAHMRRIVNISNLKMSTSRGQRGPFSIKAEFNSVVYMQKPEPPPAEALQGN